MSGLSTIGAVEIGVTAFIVLLFGVNSLVKVLSGDVLETISVTKRKCYETGVCKEKTVTVTEEWKNG